MITVAEKVCADSCGFTVKAVLVKPEFREKLIGGALATCQ
jgi:hypothetical protein